MKFSATMMMLALLLGLHETAWADSWRCGRQLVKTGDTTAAVTQRCGRPDFSDRGRESVRSSGSQKRRTVSTSRWTYTSGRSGSSKTLVFADGRLLRIEHNR